mgnify:CR=1 FL=1
MMQVYDRVLPTGGKLTLVWITVIVALAVATLSALEAVRARLLARVSSHLDRMLAGAVLDRVLSRRAQPGGLAQSQQFMREFDTLRSALSGPAATSLLDLPWTPIFLLVAVLIHPLLGLLVAAASVLMIALALRQSRRSRALEAEARAANLQAYASQDATLRRAEAVRALGMRDAIITRHLQDRASGVAAGMTLQESAESYNGLTRFWRIFLQSLALGLGAWLAIGGEISAGAIIAASVLLARALQPVEQLARSWPQVVQARQALAALAELFASSPGEATVRTSLPAPQGKLTVRKLTLRSPDQTALVLRNVGFALDPGSICCIVGPSGAGKTTLARTLAGAVAPDLGEIRIDGASIRDWPADRLAPHIGYLPQEPSLLPGTIADNISRFQTALAQDRGALDAGIVAAAKAAGVHDMVLALAQGYDTAIETGGHHLSAGQAQRIALARALFGEPVLLILDEPDAALDSDGEAALQTALAEARGRGATILVVTHRPAILSIATRILVVRDGEVAHFGPSEEVLATLRAAAETARVVPIKREAAE